MNLFETEKTIPSDEDLTSYSGLQAIRFRRDGKLAVGLFIRDEDSKTVVVLHPRKNADPFVFDVDPSEASAAFEEPWPYAPMTGKIIIEETLARNTFPQAA
jgi:hypothetical protein